MMYSITSSASIVWNCWTTTATLPTSDAVWGYWTNATSDSTTTATTTSNTIWVRWNGHYTYEPTQQEILSQEELQRQLEVERRWREDAERRAAEQAERAKEEEKLRIVAEKRAEELLLAHLDKEQAKQYRKQGRFRVIGGDGAAFEVGRGWSGNVTELGDKGKPVARFCIHPREWVPEPDLMLAQKFLLETDVETFRKTANKTAIPA